MGDPNVGKLDRVRTSTPMVALKSKSLPQSEKSAVQTTSVGTLLSRAAGSDSSYRDVVASLKRTHVLARRDADSLIASTRAVHKNPKVVPAPQSGIAPIVAKMGAADKKAVIEKLWKIMVSGSLPSSGSIFNRFVIALLKKAGRVDGLNGESIRAAAIRAYGHVVCSAKHVVIRQEAARAHRLFSTSSISMKLTSAQAFAALAPKLSRDDVHRGAQRLRTLAFKLLGRRSDKSEQAFEAYRKMIPFLRGRDGVREERLLSQQLMNSLASVRRYQQVVARNPYILDSLRMGLRAYDTLSSFLGSMCASSAAKTASAALPVLPVTAQPLFMKYVSHVPRHDAQRVADAIIHKMQKKLPSDTNRDDYRKTIIGAKDSMSHFVARDRAVDLWVKALAALASKTPLHGPTLTKACAAIGRYMVKASYKGKAAAYAFFTAVSNGLSSQDASIVLNAVRDSLAVDDIPLPASYREVRGGGASGGTKRVQVIFRRDELRTHKRWPTMAASLYWKLAPKLDSDDAVSIAEQLRKLFFRTWGETARALARRYGADTLRRHVREARHGAPFSLSDPRRARMFSLVAYASLAKKLQGIEIINGMLYLNKSTTDPDSTVSSLAKGAYDVFNRSLGAE